MRQRDPTTPRKATVPGKRHRSRSPSVDPSDEEGYSAVEEISDNDDDDEADVEAAEEEHITGRERHLYSRPPRLREFDDNDGEDEGGAGGGVEIEDEGDDDDDDDDDDDGYMNKKDFSHDEGTQGNHAHLDDGDDSDSNGLDDQEPALSPAPAPIERRVRFAVDVAHVSSSESDSTDTEDDHAELFPDIFVAKNSLDPSFRRAIERDGLHHQTGGVWEYPWGNYETGGDDLLSEEFLPPYSDQGSPAVVTPIDTPATPQAVSNTPATQSTQFVPCEEPQELDGGYETDGDTTEDEEPLEPPIKRKMRRPSLSETGSGSEADEPIQCQRGKPRVGSFNLDRSDRKPIAVVNPILGRMMIFTPHKRHQLDLSPEQFSLQGYLYAARQQQQQSSPIVTGPPANLILDAMFSFNTFGDYVNSNPHVLASPGLGLPLTGLPSEPNSSDYSPSSMEEDDEDEAERNLDITDFITWGEESSDDNNEDEDDRRQDSTIMRQRLLAATGERPETASSDSDGNGDGDGDANRDGDRDGNDSYQHHHLDSKIVGLFRRNQIDQQLLLREKATPDSLAFSGPYNYTALRGIKSDRFETASSPLTPMRRRRSRLMIDGGLNVGPNHGTNSPNSSPLQSISQKRKASDNLPSSAMYNHKRQRSISDVNLLSI